MAGEKSGDIIEVNETRDFVATVKLDKEYLYRISVNPKGEKKISLHIFSAHHESVFDDKKPVFEGALNDLKELDVSIGANTYRLKFLIFDESKLADPNATDVLADKYSENTRIGISSEVFVFPTVNGAIVGEKQVAVTDKLMEDNDIVVNKPPLVNNIVNKQAMQNTVTNNTDNQDEIYVDNQMINEDDIEGGNLLSGFTLPPTFADLIRLNIVVKKKGLTPIYIYGDKQCQGCEELKGSITKGVIPENVVIFDIPGKGIDENNVHYKEMFGIDHSDPDKFYDMPRIVISKDNQLFDYTQDFLLGYGDYKDASQVQKFLNSVDTYTKELS